MTSTHPAIRTALEAWMNGDFSALEATLAPEVDLLWHREGPWDCHGREQVLALMRRRRSEGAMPAEVHIEAIDANTLVAWPADPDRPRGFDDESRAVRVSIRDGLITHMHQYRSRDDALTGTREHQAA
jgi:ketosteroid isomerase-like protein